MGIGAEGPYDVSAHGVKKKPILVGEDRLGKGCGCGKGP